jgi:hypothetical protein
MERNPMGDKNVAVPEMYFDGEKVLRYTRTSKRVLGAELDRYRRNLGNPVETKVVEVEVEVPVEKIVTKTRVRTVKEIVEVAPKDPAEEAVTRLPRQLAQLVQNMRLDPQLNEGMEAMMPRWQEFREPIAAVLAGVAMHRPSREAWDDFLDRRAETATLPLRRHSEVVVGSGLHAAVYVASRVRAGFYPPIVVEKAQRAGGSFAVSKRPSFFLNSRNRPGELGLPGNPMSSLNVIPGGVIQPSDITSQEFMSNDDMAWVIRANLAVFALVRTGFTATQFYDTTQRAISYPLDRECIQFKNANGNNRTFYADRVLTAAGLGLPAKLCPNLNENDGYFTFPQAMALCDSTFPLQGMKRVAVLGAGDGGRCVIEMLTGKGPAMPMSASTLDYPEQIDWYGVDSSKGACDAWTSNVRSRYKGIGSLLFNSTRVEYKTQIGGTIIRAPRVRTFSNAPNVLRAWGGLRIGLLIYDVVIDCTGYTANDPFAAELNPVFVPDGDERALAVYGGKNRQMYVKPLPGYSRYRIGPSLCPVINTTAEENTELNGIEENKTSLFRWAPKTAMLAQMLPETKAGAAYAQAEKAKITG